MNETNCLFKVSGLVLLDLNAAFDALDHNNLLWRLEHVLDVK